MFIKNFSFFDEKKYCKVCKSRERLLVENGFVPVGRDDKYSYFVRTTEIEFFLKKRGEQG